VITSWQACKPVFCCFQERLAASATLDPSQRHGLRAGMSRPVHVISGNLEFQVRSRFI